MTYETIGVRREGRVGVLTLNRPQVLNALNRNLMREVTETMAAFTKDDEVLAIIVNGEGRAFSAGFDMKESAQRNTTTLDQWRAVLGADFDFLRHEDSQT